jgi:hypothetical protein
MLGIVCFLLLQCWPPNKLAAIVAVAIITVAVCAAILAL